MFRKKEEITITKEDLRNAFTKIIANPFKGLDVPEEDKTHLQLSIMLNGMMILKLVEEELFGEGEE